LRQRAENFLTRFERRKLKHIQPDCCINLGQCRRLDQRDAFGNRQHVPPVDDHLFGHPTPGQQGANPIADLPRTEPCADLADDPGALKTEHLAGPWWRRIEPCFL
jgi:hypothetical protein